MIEKLSVVSAQLKLRVPAEMKAQLQAEAVANERSLNGEILARLRSTFKARRTQQPQTKGLQQ